MQGDAVDARAFRRLADDLDAMARGLKDELKGGFTDAGEIVARDARARAPRSTTTHAGRLAGSIRVKAIHGGARITVGAKGTGGYPYAARVSFDQHRRHTPFLDEALRASGPKAIQVIHAHVYRIIDRYWQGARA